MATTSTLSLKSLLVPSKSVELEYPGYPDFKVTLNFLSRETLLNIRKKSTKTSFKNRQGSEELDEKLFLQMYSAATVKGWKGLKLSILEQLAPIDISGSSPDDELEFSPEEALNLMQASANFDGFVSETVSELTNFTKSSAKQ